MNLKFLYIENNSDSYLLKLEEKYSIKFKLYHKYFPKIYCVDDNFDFSNENIVSISENFLIPLSIYQQEVSVNSFSENGNWGLLRLAQKENWSEKNWLPIEGNYVSHSFGKNVNVFLFDSGIAEVGLEFKTANIETIYDFENKGGTDINGHGTSVCSIVAGLKYGIAKKCNIFNLKLTNNGNILFKNLIDSFITAIDIKNNKKLTKTIANIGFDSNHLIIEYLLYVLSCNDFIVIAPIGNNGQKVDRKYKNQNLILVGSTNIIDEISKFSNSSKDIILYAPGENIGTLSIRKRIKTEVVSGTSFSASFVTGCLALFLEKNDFNLTKFLEKNVLNKKIPLLICDEFSINDFDNKEITEHKLNKEQEKRKFAIEKDLNFIYTRISTDEQQKLLEELLEIKKILILSDNASNVSNYFSMYNKIKNLILAKNNEK